MKRLRPLVIFLVVLIVLSILGGFYQTTGEKRDLAAHPAPGTLYDVGVRLHLYCTGQGSPTVILLHGLGGNVYHWVEIQPEIAATTRVCAYDRAGYGWSEPGPRPRSPLQNARELHTLLEQADITGPIILVGHSWGTNGAQVYADQYPENVVGLVLVDGGIATEAMDQCPTLNCMPPAAQTGTDIFLSLQPFLFRVGLLRLFGFPQPFGDSLKFLSPEERAALNAGYGQTQGAETNLAEWEDWDNEVGQVGEPGSLGDVPVRVLMAEESLPDWVYGRDAETWRGYGDALNAALTRLSTDSQVMVIPNSDHASLLFDPAQWTDIVSAVLDIVTLTKTP